MQTRRQPEGEVRMEFLDRRDGEIPDQGPRARFVPRVFWAVLREKWPLRVSYSAVDARIRVVFARFVKVSKDHALRLRVRYFRVSNHEKTRPRIIQSDRSGRVAHAGIESSTARAIPYAGLCRR